METSAPNLRLDTSKVRKAMHNHGFGSIQALAESLGLHRNTVSNYLTGKTGFPEALGLILAKLDLKPADVIILDQPHRQVPALELADLLDQLLGAQPHAAFVLFGSRARGRFKSYSDYDLGVFSESGLWFREYSRLLDIIAEWNDTRLHEVQLVNLNQADVSFLANIAPDLQHLAGSMGAWCELLRKAGWNIHE